MQKMLHTPDSIRTIRKQKKVSQTNLADSCKVSRWTIWRAEKGEYVSLSVILRMAKALSVPAERILSESGLEELAPVGRWKRGSKRQE